VTEPKEKTKPTIKTRTPGRLSRGNMFERVKLREELPHPINEIIVGTSPSISPQPDIESTSHPTQTKPRPEASQTRPRPIAPERDFNKRANSIERDALPAGLLVGAGKALYDALYLRTRGAVSPKRIIQARRRELIAWSGIKNIKTINTHIKRLSEKGLLKHTQFAGEHGGSLYEVFLPEEAILDQTQTSTSPVPDPNQKMVSDQYQKTVWVGSGNTIENKGTSESPKTSFKTKEENFDDDAALASFITALKSINRELTGKDISEAESVRWRELADVLIAELKIAAARTTVSSVPSFLAEHLRRRLWKIDRKQARAEGRELPDQNVASSASVEQAKDCPDCGGTGFRYRGTDFSGGVEKCKHEVLKKSPA
jgi:hypothetical protein